MHSNAVLDSGGLFRSQVIIISLFSSPTPFCHTAKYNARINVPRIVLHLKHASDTLLLHSSNMRAGYISSHTTSYIKVALKLAVAVCVRAVPVIILKYPFLNLTLMHQAAILRFHGSQMKAKRTLMKSNH